ncbi:MAG TPA: potassium-transporting ATPase subunit KdpA [Parachlamydiaceae bacterium]|nr:potassium-transporting ATPase subunit KdpA [Parachlamydiaceae bacterium]
MHQSIFEWLQILSFLLLASVLAFVIGGIWSSLVHGRSTVLHPFLEWLENSIYRYSGINPQEEMGWTAYAKNLVVFNLCGGILLFILLLLQGYLPLNPQSFSGVPFIQAFNITVSFMTNTNWQSYAGESTLSYASQMLGLTTQNFLSAATGSAVLMALIRGITRATTKSIGNFWADMVRSVVYLLLPLSVILALFLTGQGVVQTLSSYETVETLEKAQQVIPLGPVASQVAIKQIGTNGGGFFNASSAHPFENPTVLSNLFQMVFLLAIPAGMVYGYGLLIGSKRHAFLILGVMFGIWAAGFAIALFSESRINPVTDAYPLWEGKEVRIGNTNSVLWAITTTATSNGSINMMLESLTPLAGGVTLFNMMIGEVSFGGIGVGLSRIIMYILLTVFLCGLMVGRTPEYKGKKLDKRDIQWIVLAILTPSVLILIGAGISSILPTALSSLSSRGPHGLTELLYAFTSSAANNGSAFAGLDANTNYYNIVLAVVMVLGRLGIIIPSLAIAGSFASKKIIPHTAGTLSTNSILFGILLFFAIVILGSLAFLPALSLGPIVEQLLMMHGQTVPVSGEI